MTIQGDLEQNFYPYPARRRRVIDADHLRERLYGVVQELERGVEKLREQPNKFDHTINHMESQIKGLRMALNHAADLARED